jgi:hypothetical protein
MLLLDYHLHLRDGDPLELQASSDADAIQIAERSHVDHCTELWCRSRLVKRWEAAAPQSPRDPT